MQPSPQYPAGDIRGTAENQFLDRLWLCDPADQRRANALGISLMCDQAVQELINMFREDSSATMARGNALDTKASSILAVLGLFGTVFLSSSSPVFTHLSSHLLQVAAFALAVLFGLVIYYSLRVTRVHSYYAVYDGYLLNVKPRRNGQTFGPGCDPTPVLRDDAALPLALDTAFDRSGYLKKNLLNIVQVNAMNRQVNLEKAKWLKRSQTAFVALLVVLVFSAVYLGVLAVLSPTPAPH